MPLFVMEAIPILVIILLILLWFLLSPLFRWMGSGINKTSSYIKKGMTEDDIKVCKGSNSNGNTDNPDAGTSTDLHN